MTTHLYLLSAWAVGVDNKKQAKSSFWRCSNPPKLAPTYIGFSTKKGGLALSLLSAMTFFSFSTFSFDNSSKQASCYQLVAAWAFSFDEDGRPRCLRRTPWHALAPTRQHEKVLLTGRFGLRQAGTMTHVCGSDTYEVKKVMHMTSIGWQIRSL